MCQKKIEKNALRCCEELALLPGEGAIMSYSAKKRKIPLRELLSRFELDKDNTLLSVLLLLCLNFAPEMYDLFYSNACKAHIQYTLNSNSTRRS